MTRGRAVETPHGPANAHLHLADRPRAALMLGHGAGGGVASRDLMAVTDVALAAEVSVALVEQPYRVAGRRSPAPAHQLDVAWTAVVEHLHERRAGGVAAPRRRPVPRRAGRMPHRRGHRRRRGAVPRVPASAPAPVRAAPPPEPPPRARRGDRADAGRAGCAGPVRDSAGNPAPYRGAGARRPQPEDGPRRGGGCRGRLASRSPPSGGWPVSDPVARARSQAGGAVAGVGELAAVEREAAAADAFGQAALEALELGDARVDPRRPRGREPGPVGPVGRLVGRELGQLGGDLVERQADALGEDDEGDAAEDRPRVAPMAGAARSELIKPRCS